MSQEVVDQRVSLLGASIGSWLAGAEEAGGSSDAEIIYCTSLQQAQSEMARLRPLLAEWEARSIKLEEGDLWLLHPSTGPALLLKPKPLSEAQKRDGGRLAPSPFAQARDLCGRAVSELKRFKLTSVRFRCEGASALEQKGALVGLELAAYSYKSTMQPQLSALPRLQLDLPADVRREAKHLATATNIARHLVNSPPNKLYPEAFAATVSELFIDEPGLGIEIWDAERLKRENMGLHLAVGQGSEFGPCLLKMRYRPAGAVVKAPIALVGKGITFDSGGLDIKDPAGMRLMKKDMGGAAAIVGAFYWLVKSGLKRPVDVYLPMAENAISGRAFRPGDILKAKNGMTVEIHNTDAEGRLVLADSIALAAAQVGEDKPAAILVAATLTGAIKVGLGADVAGFFANSDELAEVVARQSQQFGDLMWRMPLFDGYRSRLETSVADIVHCATGAFGGAITAALFLAEFAQGLPLVHMDIYAWTDAERGALREAGGSGQAVQALAGVLQTFLL